MGLDFSAGDLAQLCSLISESATDIVVECDAEGFILQASHGIEHLNEPLPAFLIPPRLYDLVAPEHVGLIRAELALAADGNDSRGWTEFLLAAEGRAGRWFALRLTPAPDGKGRVLGIMRDVHERRMLEDKLFAARLTDPLTGLTNRIAFDDMLKHVAAHRIAGCLGLFGIDHFRAINHRLGHDFGNDVLKGFAEVLRTVMRTGDTLSRIGDAQFAVLFLGIDHGKASNLAQQAQRIDTLGVREFEIVQHDIGREVFEHVLDALHAPEIADDFDIRLRVEHVFDAVTHDRVVIDEQSTYRRYRRIGHHDFPAGWCIPEYRGSGKSRESPNCSECSATLGRLSINSRPLWHHNPRCRAGGVHAVPAHGTGACVELQ